MLSSFKSEQNPPLVLLRFPRRDKRQQSDSIPGAGRSQDPSQDHGKSRRVTGRSRCWRTLRSSLLQREQEQVLHVANINITYIPQDSHPKTDLQKACGFDRLFRETVRVPPLFKIARGHTGITNRRSCCPVLKEPCPAALTLSTLNLWEQNFILDWVSTWKINTGLRWDKGPVSSWVYKHKKKKKCINQK